jgi:hypothetical protein
MQVMIDRANQEVEASFFGALDRDWPHQVALRESLATGKNHKLVEEFCKDLSICSRGHAVFHESEFWQVFCFAEAADADKFQRRFGGEKFDPNQKGKGSNWARWKKP